MQHFEYTTECIIFDLLGISLYHGWLVDPQSHDIVSAIGMCSYNQLVEKIIVQKTSEDIKLFTEGKFIFFFPGYLHRLKISNKNTNFYLHKQIIVFG